MSQLTEFGTVTLDANGNGQVSLGPQVVRERWNPAQATVSASTNALEARCAIYLGIANVAGLLLGQTATGSSGDTYGFGAFEMQPGQSIVAVWEGGDPGAVATIALMGEKWRGGR